MSANADENNQHASVADDLKRQAAMFYNSTER